MTTSLQSVRLSHTEVGRGLPVVLLHGFPLDGSIWQHELQDLAENYRVIVPDLRGHGKSLSPEGAYDMTLMAQDVFDLLDELRVRESVILGHSMGGYVTLAGWRLAPERFLGLGLIASHPFADSDEGRQGRLRMAERVLAEGNQLVVDAMLAKLFAPGISSNDPIVLQVRDLILAASPIGISGTQRGMAARADSTDLLPRILIPSLVMAGEYDQIVPLDRTRQTAAALPNSTLAVISGAGHMPMLERTAATTSALQAFLKGI